VPQHLGAGAGSFTAGVEAVLFYLVAYGAMTVGAFSIIAYLHNPQRPVETVDDLGGLSRSHPRSALAMALFLFSLIGIPLTAGFLGKLLLFLAVLGVPAEALDVASLEQARLFRILALVAAINAAIGAWYYLRICAVMYLRNPLRPPQEQRRAPVLAAIGACAVLTLALGIYPPPLLRSVDQAVPKPPATAAADR
jgi:NADH-quinone oxidoreductase subunit N